MSDRSEHNSGDELELITDALSPKVHPAVTFLLSALFVFCLIIFVYSAFIGSPLHAWVSFHVNFTFWLMVAAGGTCFSAALEITDAKWARPVKRIFASFAPFLYLSLIPLGAVYIFGSHHLFSWIEEPVAGKEWWLSYHFLFIRDLLALAFLAFLGNKAVRLSIQRDVLSFFRASPSITGIKREKWKALDSVGASQLSAEALAERLSAVANTRRLLLPFFVGVYAVIMSLLAFDQIMSMEPHWYSTLFGGYFFMSAMYVAVAAGCIGGFFALRYNNFYRQLIKPALYHDLGKLLLGFGIFWAYMIWCHYLTIWYGNIPEETVWLIRRTRLEPWHSVSWIVLGMCFIYPFLFGLSKAVKFRPGLVAFTSGIVGIGTFLQQYVLIAPALYPDTVPLGILDLAVTVAFLSAFVLSSLTFLSRAPLMPLE